MYKVIPIPIRVVDRQNQLTILFLTFYLLIFFFYEKTKTTFGVLCPIIGVE